MVNNEDFDAPEGMDELEDLDDLLQDGSINPKDIDRLHYTKESAKEKDDGSLDSFIDDRVEDHDEPTGVNDPTSVQRRSNRKRAKRKRKFVSAPILNPDPGTLQEAINILREYYDLNPQAVGSMTVDAKIHEVIDESKKGWACASRDFIQRLVWKTKCNKLKNIGAASAKVEKKVVYEKEKEKQLRKEIAEAEQKDVYRSFSADSLKSVLRPEELKVWLEREAEYRREFDFNNSSDYTLLYTALLEELTHHRLMLRRMQDPYDDVEFSLSESLKRLTIALDNLGVTRKQREKDQFEKEGNVSALSESLDKKLAQLEKMDKKDRLEEQAMKMRSEKGEGFEQLPKDLKDVLIQVASTEDIFDASPSELTRTNES